MKLNDNQTGTEAVISTTPYSQDPAWMNTHWMAYTGNRNFKATAHDKKRMMVSAQGAYYTDASGFNLASKVTTHGAGNAGVGLIYLQQAGQDGELHIDAHATAPARRVRRPASLWFPASACAPP